MFDSTSFHHLPYQPSSRLSGLVSDCTGISVKGLGLALTCFSDVGRNGVDESMPLHGVSIVPKSSASLDYSARPPIGVLVLKLEGSLTLNRLTRS